MKKMLALLLALTMVLSFAACGEKTEVAKDGEPVTVVWYLPNDKQADTQMISEAASEISMKEIGVKVDLQFIDTAAFTQRMNMNFASGSDEFDLCFTGYINPYKDQVKRDAYLELDDYIAKSDKIKEAIPDYAIKCSTINGHVYALPNMQIMATSGTGIFIQEDLAQEYGLNLDDIKCLEDLEPFMDWVKEKYPTIYPFKTGSASGGAKGSAGVDGVPFVRSDGVASGVTVVEKDGKLVVDTVLDKENQERGEAERKLMRKWYEKGYIRQDIASVTDETSDQKAGKYAVWRGVYKPGAAEEHNANNPENRCIVKLINTPYVPYNSGSTTMTAINAASKHPDEAFKVIELANTNKEFFNLLAWGIEGTHYDLDADGKVVLKEGSGYRSNGAWKFGSVFNQLLLPGQSDDLWEETKKFNDEAEKSPIMGFSFNPDNVRTQIAQYSKVGEKYTQGGKGFEPIEAWWPSYIKEMEGVGVEDIKAEVEKQLDEWLKANK